MVAPTHSGKRFFAKNRKANRRTELSYEVILHELASGMKFKTALNSVSRKKAEQAASMFNLIESNRLDVEAVAMPLTRNGRSRVKDLIGHCEVAA